jgi:hypothetical protein
MANVHLTVLVSSAILQTAALAKGKHRTASDDLEYDGSKWLEV